MFAEHGDFGGCATVSVEGLPIDIIVTDTNHLVERHQTLAAGVDWMDYDVVIVKTGYAFPEPTQQGALCVMSLTDGATLQDTRRLPSSASCAPCSQLTISKCVLFQHPACCIYNVNHKTPLGFPL